VLQEAIEEKLDAKKFPFLSGGARSVGSMPVRYSLHSYTGRNNNFLNHLSVGQV
jgi:hypothetical protein